MKANAPEKIYIHKSQYWGLMANEHNITKDGIEYIMKDAFIEKAYAYLDSIGHRYIIDSFRKYIEKE